MQFWDLNSENRYQQLLDDMLDSEFIEFASTLNITKEPGVYSLWHQDTPMVFAEKILTD